MFCKRLRKRSSDKQESQIGRPWGGDDVLERRQHVIICDETKLKLKGNRAIFTPQSEEKDHRWANDYGEGEILFLKADKISRVYDSRGT